MILPIWAFLTGLAGSLHCFGMCGPLVIAYSLNVRQNGPCGRDGEARGGRARSLVFHHLAFHGGRIAAYAITGLVAAALVHMVGSIDSFRDARSIISLVGGCLMVILGFSLLRIVSLKSIPLPAVFSRDKRNGTQPGQALSSRIVASLLKPHAGPSQWGLGFAAGFLPCMLSWAMVVKAAATGDMAAGPILMLFFGLGTMPALLFTGLFSSFLTQRMRLTGERLAGASVLAMGLILIWKGVSHLA